MFPPFNESAFKKPRPVFRRGAHPNDPEFDPEQRLTIEEITVGQALSEMAYTRTVATDTRVALQLKAQMILLSKASPFQQGRFYPQISARYEGVVSPGEAIYIKRRQFLYHFAGEEVNWEREWCHCFRLTDGALLFVRYDSETLINELLSNAAGHPHRRQKY